jgi:protein-S-isoprenylcysteine O-methyltransferase Ste14
VPLSEHEQRLLEQIEQALYAEDPKFAHSWRTKNLHGMQRSRLTRAVVAVVLGLALLVAGVVVQSSNTVLGVVLGVAGFLAMLAGAWLILSSRRPTPAGATRTVAGPRLSIRERLEERWERRQDRR